MGQDVSPSTIQRLERFTFLTRATVAGKVRRPFLVQGVSVDEMWAESYDPDAVEILEKQIDVNVSRIRRSPSSTTWTAASPRPLSFASAPHLSVVSGAIETS
jgi:hypothetical protein